MFGPRLKELRRKKADLLLGARDDVGMLCEIVIERGCASLLSPDD
jgi:hypothetical protein